MKLLNNSLTNRVAINKLGICFLLLKISLTVMASVYNISWPKADKSKFVVTSTEPSADLIVYDIHESIVVYYNDMSKCRAVVVELVSGANIPHLFHIIIWSRNVKVESNGNFHFRKVLWAPIASFKTVSRWSRWVEISQSIKWHSRHLVTSTSTPHLIKTPYQLKRLIEDSCF